MKPALSDIQTLVRLQLGLNEIKSDDHLVEHLGAESADIVNIVVALEEKYGIIIDESTMADLETVEDLFRIVEQQS